MRAHPALGEGSPQDEEGGWVSLTPRRGGRTKARRPVVTVAALYGAGGSVVGPRVAERLGVEFLDRAIPASVARRMGLPEAAVASYDEQPRSRMGRLSREPGTGAKPLRR